MPHLLHIDSSIQGDSSVSRALSARARDRWLASHEGGSVTYRDLGANPVPHFTSLDGLARHVPAEGHSPEQAASWALSLALIEEVRAADTVVLGLPLYNFGPPSAVKSWVDHLIAPDVTMVQGDSPGLFGGTEIIVTASRGGGYGEGTPREGWDHAEPWLPHVLSVLGLEPRLITAELTLAPVKEQLADLIPLAEASRAEAERQIDELWAPVAA